MKRISVEFPVSGEWTTLTHHDAAPDGHELCLAPDTTIDLAAIEPDPERLALGLARAVWKREFKTRAVEAWDITIQNAPQLLVAWAPASGVERQGYAVLCRVNAKGFRPKRGWHQPWSLENFEHLTPEQLEDRATTLRLQRVIHHSLCFLNYPRRGPYAVEPTNHADMVAKRLEPLLAQGLIAFNRGARALALAS